MGGTTTAATWCVDVATLVGWGIVVVVVAVARGTYATLVRPHGGRNGERDGERDAPT